MLFYFLISSALAQPVSNATFGFTPTYTECINIKNQLCSTSVDPTCVALDAGIMLTMMNFPGMEGFYGQMPAGFVGVSGVFPPATLAATLAQFAYMVTYNQTGGVVSQIYPALNAIYECEARNAGLVWSTFADTWSAVQICMEDAACLTAFDNIRVKTLDAPPEPFEDYTAVWTYIASIDFWMPLAPDNNDNQYCGVLFATLEEENIKAMNALTAWATLNLDGDNLLTHCNKLLDDWIEDTMKKVMMMLGLVGGGCFFAGSLMFGLGCYCCNRGKKESSI